MGKHPCTLILRNMITMICRSEGGMLRFAQKLKHSLYCLFLMLVHRPFVFPNPIGFDVKPLSVTFSFALLSPGDNYCLSLKIHTNLGAWVFVTHSAANENRPCRWQWRQLSIHVLTCGLINLRRRPTNTCLTWTFWDKLTQQILSLLSVLEHSLLTLSRSLKMLTVV